MEDTNKVEQPSQIEQSEQPVHKAAVSQDNHEENGKKVGQEKYGNNVVEWSLL